MGSSPLSFGIFVKSGQGKISLNGLSPSNSLTNLSNCSELSPLSDNLTLFSHQFGIILWGLLYFIIIENPRKNWGCYDSNYTVIPDIKGTTEPDNLSDRYHTQSF